MRQFYEICRNDEKLSTLVRELPWTHNMIILSKHTRREERAFYVPESVRSRDDEFGEGWLMPPDTGLPPQFEKRVIANC